MGAVEGSGGGQRLWRGSKGSGGSKHEALEAAGSSGGGRRLRRQQARSLGDGWRLWRWSKVVEEVSEGLEEVEGLEAASTKLWRRQEALKAVEGSAGGQRLWGRSKAPEAASLKLWRRQEAVEAAGSSGGGRRMLCR
jgi:hypothetical protein